MRVTTIVGRTNVRGHRDGEFSQCTLSGPREICLDGQGNLLVADCWNHCIRKVDTVHEVVTTIAGGEKRNGFIDGPAPTKAKFNQPSYLTIHDDTIYVYDIINAAIRKIENGMVSTLIRMNVRGIAVDTNGDVLAVDHWNDRIVRIDSRNGITYTFLAPIGSPTSIAVSQGGTIYVSTAGGIIVCWDEGNWKVITRTNEVIYELKVDSFDNLLFVSRSPCIKKFELGSGRVSVLAGSEKETGMKDGTLLESRFETSLKISTNADSIFISDTINNTIRKISLLISWNTSKRIRTFLIPFQETTPCFLPTWGERY